MDSQNNGDGAGYASGGGSDSDGAKPPTKRAKGRSRVWEKVAWLTRRGRASRYSQSSENAAMGDEACAAALPECMEVDQDLPSTASNFSPAMSRPLSECSSSSEGDLMANPLCEPCYPNSEVDSKSCIRPSLIRAMFRQLEPMSYNRKNPKFARTCPKSASRGTDGEDSSPGERDSSCISSSSGSPSTSKKHNDDSANGDSCHCPACCSCRLGEPSPSGHNSWPRKKTCPLRASLDLSNSNLLSMKGRNLVSRCTSACQDTILDNKDGRIPREFDIPRTRLSLPSALSHVHCDCNGHCLHGRYLSLCKKMLGEASQRRICKHSKAHDGVDGPTFKHRMEVLMEWFGEFDDQQKNIMLKKLLSQCQLPQMHLLSVAMETQLHKSCPHNCQDLLSWLPTQLSFYILSFLDPVSLCHCSQVSRSWNELANEPSIWRLFCKLPKYQLSRAGEQKQMINHMSPYIHWKQVFAERYRLRRNWLNGYCTVRTFEGHTQGISCVQFDDTRIVSGSSDKTIKVWNIRTNTPWSVLTLVGHSGTVRCLHLEGNRLVSGSTDANIKVWDLSMQSSWSSIACRVTMVGHTDTVRCLQVDDEKVVSGSYDKTLKIWDIRTGRCRTTLRGHTSAVLCLQFDDDKIVSGSCDKTIKIWNLSLGTCLMTLEGHQDAVTCLQFDAKKIISGSLDSNIKFWDINTGECTSTLDWANSEGHTGVVRCLQADSWRIVSAADDKTLKVWNLETGERLVTLRHHTDGVTCLQFNDSMIVSGSYDKTVKLWDFTSI
ncbi:F-box/WD repeat-containing protein 7-like [Ptychodera flava]|uniref:F-box/WD repeat-containing protein 7-like n=1 Tax=Ptychodera flava TaxID=63121 RepID=UPI00396A9482